MIVKNEGVMLEQCLESVKDADEIIIVDTGSQDNTKEIAQKFTSNLFDFEWIDDFSAARNFAKTKCTGDYILSIDADETLEEGGIQKIKDFLSNYDKGAAGLIMKSTNQEYVVPRIIKNTPFIYFRGKVHEAPNTLDFDISNPINVNITFGSSPAHALDPERNVRIMQKVFNEFPNDTRNLYYLGREYGYKKEWIKAIAILEEYVKISEFMKEKADAFFLLAVCYMSNGDWENARNNCLFSISINANFKAPIMLMAHLSFPDNAKQWRKMAETATNEGTLFVRDNWGII